VCAHKRASQRQYPPSKVNSAKVFYDDDDHYYAIHLRKKKFTYYAFRRCGDATLDQRNFIRMKCTNGPSTEPTSSDLQRHDRLRLMSAVPQVLSCSLSCSSFFIRPIWWNLRKTRAWEMHTLKSRYVLSSVNKFSILSNCRIESLSLNQQKSSSFLPRDAL